MSPELSSILDEVCTPESVDDLDGIAQLGKTMIFGHDLTPDELDQFADVLKEHATTARRAIARADRDQLDREQRWGGGWDL